MFGDLRQYISKVDEVDRLRLVEGADWNLEIGVLTELLCAPPDSTMVLFDRIKGYPQGYRVVANLMSTPRRFALATGLPLEARGLGLVNGWRDRIGAGFTPIHPAEVQTGPIAENVHTGSDIDVFEFPVPQWHELDGGRYIGTCDMIIVKDPDSGWVNFGTYRVQIHDRDVVTIFLDPGRHADYIRRKYWAKGVGCPVAIVCGQEPLMWLASISRIAQNVSEYDYAGWLRGRPVEVIKGPTTGLPIPAHAEIVLEGEWMPPGTPTRMEGPFGEWVGYYASGARPETEVRLTAILHRNDPVITGSPPLSRAADPFGYGMNIMRSAQIWNELDKQVPAVKGVWALDEAAGPLIVVISIEQKYGGHAKHAAMAAATTYTLAQLNRFIIVVDDDIDPSNLNQVLWALGTRCDPETSIDIIRDCYGGPLDPILSPDKRNRADYTHSKAIVSACKPYYWIKDFPTPVATSREMTEQVRRKWQHLF